MVVRNSQEKRVHDKEFVLSNGQRIITLFFTKLYRLTGILFEFNEYFKEGYKGKLLFRM